MPVNMHHCRFENTFRALEEIEDDLLDPEAKLSISEKCYKKEIIQKIQEWASDLSEE